MATFEITSEVKNSQYKYENNDVIVNGGFVTNTKDNKVTNINGGVYHKENDQQGAFIGNFNGQLRNDEIKYSLSEMTKADSDLVWAAIEDIETEILK